MRDALQETMWRPGPMGVFGLLFQARMWREYAQCWDGRVLPRGIDRAWVEQIGGVDRAECIRRSRVALSLAALARIAGGN